MKIINNTQFWIDNHIELKEHFLSLKCRHIKSIKRSFIIDVIMKIIQIERIILIGTELDAEFVANELVTIYNGCIDEFGENPFE